MMRTPRAWASTYGVRTRRESAAHRFDEPLSRVGVELDRDAGGRPQGRGREVDVERVLVEGMNGVVVVHRRVGEPEPPAPALTAHGARNPLPTFDRGDDPMAGSVYRKESVPRVGVAVELGRLAVRTQDRLECVDVL